jgi:nucleotide-binding universal stress UspA family protein
VFGKILFATDFSAYAKNVLDCIAGFPGAREVILVHIINEVHSPRGGGEIGGELYRGGENNLLREEKRRLESLSQSLRVTTAVKTSSDTAGAIIGTAKEMGVSLIVVGARGNTLVEGILLGSVSRAVLRRSRTNVLIMRHTITRDITGETYHKFCPGILSRVLCPTDFSEYSEKAIALASRITGIGEVILLHIVSRGETEVEIADAFQKAETRLGEIRDSLAAQGISVRAIVKTGNPAHEITRIADEMDVSVIWMNSYGKGWFRELLLGSVASTVAMNAKQPVLIIRTREGT